MNCASRQVITWREAQDSSNLASFLALPTATKVAGSDRSLSIEHVQYRDSLQWLYALPGPEPG